MPHYLLLLPALILLKQYVNAEVFTALADLEDLLDTEAVLIQSLGNYIKAEEYKIELLKRYIGLRLWCHHIKELIQPL